MTARYWDRDGDQVRAREHWRIGRCPAHPFDLAAIPKSLRCARANSETDGVAGAEHSSVFGEHQARLGETSVVLLLGCPPHLRLKARGTEDPTQKRL